MLSVVFVCNQLLNINYPLILVALFRAFSNQKKHNNSALRKQLPNIFSCKCNQTRQTAL